ncbi:MAG: hypothetical protein U0892_09565 [Pirellulales bacterium]
MDDPLRDFHISALWSSADDPWFTVLDLNYDGLLSATELAEAKSRLTELDRNGDGILGLDEQPLVLEVELERKDDRLAGLTGPMAPEASEGSSNPTGPDWFTAMDLNGDKAISSVEFLGNHARFEELDRNKDGIIELGEVYSPP